MECDILPELESVRVDEIRREAAEQRSKSVITGDMQPLVDALPTTEEVNKPTNSQVASKSNLGRKHGKYRKRHAPTVHALQPVISTPTPHSNLPADTLHCVTTPLVCHTPYSTPPSPCGDLFMNFVCS